MYYNDGSFFKKINNEVKVMKKSLLLILASLFAIFALAGCAEEEKNEAPALIQPTLSNVSSLNGTYDIEFFYVNAAIAALATDCSKVEEYAPGERMCADNATDSVQHYGQATMTVNPDGSVKVFSKIQINGGVFDKQDMIGNLINQAAGDKRYNFTEYTTIPASAITSTAVNDSTVASAVTGTYGRSANRLVDDTKSVNNTFTFTVEPDGTVVNVLTDVTVMQANTIVRMKKVSNDVIALDPNTSYETPAINNFDAEAGRYEIKNN